MNNFEYLAYDSKNRFAVIRKKFNTLEEAENFRLENMATHSCQVIKPIPENTTGNISEDSAGGDYVARKASGIPSGSWRTCSTQAPP